MTDDDFFVPKAEVDAIIARGRTLMKIRATKQLPISRYYQNAGNSWDNNLMKPANLSISSSGCTLTSFTMLHNYFAGTNLNPGNVNATLGNNACDFGWAAAGTIYGHTYEGIVTCSSPIDYNLYIMGQIEANKPVIIKLSKKGNPHYVLATGYGGSVILINDPDRWNNFTELEQCLDAGYSIEHLRGYGRY